MPWTPPCAECAERFSSLPQRLALTSPVLSAWKGMLRGSGYLGTGYICRLIALVRGHITHL